MRPGFDRWVGKIPWRKEWLPTPVVFPGEFCGQRSLEGYIPRDCKESDTTERLHSHHRGCGLTILLKSSQSYNARTAPKEEKTKRKRPDGLSTIPLDKQVCPLFSKTQTKANLCFSSAVTCLLSRQGEHSVAPGRLGRGGQPPALLPASLWGKG